MKHKGGFMAMVKSWNFIIQGIKEYITMQQGLWCGDVSTTWG
jgi:hypothetical protein